MKKSIAEKRHAEVLKLAKIINPDPSAADIRNAARLMNSYYRLCGLADRNLYLSNNEYSCNTRYCKESEEKESAWHKRLNNEFNKYGLSLVYTSWIPFIGYKDIHGGFSRVIDTYFYN